MVRRAQAAGERGCCDFAAGVPFTRQAWEDVEAAPTGHSGCGHLEWVRPTAATGRYRLRRHPQGVEGPGPGPHDGNAMELIWMLWDGGRVCKQPHSSATLKCWKQPALEVSSKMRMVISPG